MHKQKAMAFTENHVIFFEPETGVLCGWGKGQSQHAGKKNKKEVQALGLYKSCTSCEAYTKIYRDPGLYPSLNTGGI